MKTLSGTVIMSKAHGPDVPYIHIEVNDKMSGCRVVDISMSLEEFAKALTSSFGAAKIEYSDGPIGWKAENKEEFVPCSVWPPDEKQSATALKPFEIDGWKARRDDLGNGHRRCENGYRVTFFRHVHPETGEPWPA